MLLQSTTLELMTWLLAKNAVNVFITRLNYLLLIMVIICKIYAFTLKQDSEIGLGFSVSGDLFAISFYSQRFDTCRARFQFTKHWESVFFVHNKRTSVSSRFRRVLKTYIEYGEI